jgi:Type VI secretion system/phage-baseplate injector OB domain
VTGEKLFGKYRAIVKNTIDPTGAARIIVAVPSLAGSLDMWAVPCISIAEMNSGEVSLPTIGASVWVEFEQGDVNLPIWVGGIWQSKL